MRLNLRSFGSMLDPETCRRMGMGAGIVWAAGVVFLGISLAHLGRRGGRARAAPLSVTMLLSVVLPHGVGVSPDGTLMPVTRSDLLVVYRQK